MPSAIAEKLRSYAWPLSSWVTRKARPFRLPIRPSAIRHKFRTDRSAADFACFIKVSTVPSSSLSVRRPSAIADERCTWALMSASPRLASQGTGRSSPSLPSAITACARTISPVSGSATSLVSSGSAAGDRMIASASAGKTWRSG